MVGAIVHMGGRIYDPTLGRFMQADPIVQAPLDSQSYNRFAYVRNNPMSYTDPSGFSWFSKAWKKLRPFVGIIAMFIPGGQGIGAAMLKGFIVGGIATGSLRGAVIGAIAAGIFQQIGSHFNSQSSWNQFHNANAPDLLQLDLHEFGGNMLTSGQVAGQIASHAAAGGVIAVATGGKFGHGFIAAGVTKGAGGAFLPGGENLSSGQVVGGTLGSAVIGGTVSTLTGGKFANGARTAAFQYMFNQISKKQKFTKFKNLWDAYPSGTNGLNARPSGDSYAINQCAIRVGVALDGAGFDISGYPEVNQTSEGWPRSSKGLADWLWNEVRPPIRMSQQTFEANYSNQKGIIYLAPPLGGIGHIDLYNKGVTGSGYYRASEVWFWKID